MTTLGADRCYESRISGTPSAAEKTAAGRASTRLPRSRGQQRDGQISVFEVILTFQHIVGLKVIRSCGPVATINLCDGSPRRSRRSAKTRADDRRQAMATLEIFMLSAHST